MFAALGSSLIQILVSVKYQDLIQQFNRIEKAYAHRQRNNIGGSYKSWRIQTMFQNIIAFCSFSVRKKKINQVISVVLRELAKKDRFSLVLVFCLFTLNMNAYDIVCLNQILNHRFFNTWYIKVLILILGQLMVTLVHCTVRESVLLT